MTQLDTLSTEQLVQEVIKNNTLIKQIAELSEKIITEIINRGETNKPVQQELF